MYSLAAPGSHVNIETFNINETHTPIKLQTRWRSFKINRQPCLIRYICAPFDELSSGPFSLMIRMCVKHVQCYSDISNRYQL